VSWDLEETAQNPIHGPIDPLMKVEEAASYLRVSRSKMYGLIEEHNLESVRFGSRRLIKRSTLDALVTQLSATHHLHTFIY
jgi:excisionase family DNA binding protein